MTLDQILLCYSTPGLRTSELSHYAKRLHLARLGIRGEDSEKILRELYPSHYSEQENGPPLQR